MPTSITIVISNKSPKAKFCIEHDARQGTRLAVAQPGSVDAKNWSGSAERRWAGSASRFGGWTAATGYTELQPNGGSEGNVGAGVQAQKVGMVIPWGEIKIETVNT